MKLGEFFTHTWGTGGTPQIPKDMDFEPIKSKESIQEITIKWNGKEEKVELKYDEK
ncbi:hypothetical protein [Bacillus sp. 1P02SD]|uniref:hypothetical protein n=1 Tax=Bacillus sp. 1P02SD TaxID=3132264 RepID=UPI0039A3BB00